MSENFSDLFIVRIFRADPLWMIGLDFVPEPVSKVRMKLSVRMETITSFDHLPSITSFNDFSLQNLHGWEVVINDIKVLELVSLVDDLLINFGKVLSSLSGESSDSFIGVEPSPTGTDFKTVEEIINVSISDIQRMDRIMKVVVKQFSISKAQNHQVTSSWNSSIQMIKKLQNVGFELSGSGHSIK